MTTETTTVLLERVSCGKCGGVYALLQSYVEQKRREGGSWTCPYCKIGWGYTEGENARLKKQLVAKDAALDRAKAEAAEQRARKDATERRLIAQRAATTRVKNRIGRGVCPCCNRTFSALARHMAHKHPGYVETTNDND